ncbi:hypothetical protein CY0110_25066 [Crocosphaera chwakensis CCY0110]|uniref:Uncharacterized protein n=2 Tax=Crocosphaera TaxID=263510 RepID=A3IMY9_9CHRO|nr:hypothetical protein CY0110_25066 [Crocosphaera chwakensis CCY0110]
MAFIYLIKHNTNKISFTNSKMETLGQITELEMIKSLWQGVQSFIFKYGDFLGENEIIKNDFDSSLENFKKQFNL